MCAEQGEKEPLAYQAKTIFSRWDHCYHLHCSVSMTRRPKIFHLAARGGFPAPSARMCLFWLEAAYFHYGLSGRGQINCEGIWTEWCVLRRRITSNRSSPLVKSTVWARRLTRVVAGQTRWEEMEEEIRKRNGLIVSYGDYRCAVQIEGWRDDSRAVISMCGNPDANLSVLLHNGDRKATRKAQTGLWCAEGETWLGWSWDLWWIYG